MYEEYKEDVEWIFNQDCRDKKRTGNGIHGRAARLRKHEAVKMPSERITDKFQKRLILGAGPCYVTNLRELKFLEWLEKVEKGEWISIEELKELPFEDGQKVYARIRTLHTTAEMYAGFKCSSAQISELSWHFQVARSGKQIIVGEPALEVLRGFTEHRQNQAEAKRQKVESNEGVSENLPARSTRKYTPRGQGKKAKDKDLQKIIENTYKDHEEIPANNITLVEVKKPEIDLLRISVKNIYTAEQVMAFLTRLQLFVEGQESKFELAVTLQETTEVS